MTVLAIGLAIDNGDSFDDDHPGADLSPALGLQIYFGAGLISLKSDGGNIDIFRNGFAIGGIAFGGQFNVIGETGGTLASTIVELTGDTWRIGREGAIPVAEIEKALA